MLALSARHQTLAVCSKTDDKVGIFSLPERGWLAKHSWQCYISVCGSAPSALLNLGDTNFIGTRYISK